MRIRGRSDHQRCLHREDVPAETVRNTRLRGTEIVDLVEADAARDDWFRRALGTMWIVAKGLPPDVVERIVIAGSRRRSGRGRGAEGAVHGDGVLVPDRKAAESGGPRQRPLDDPAMPADDKDVVLRARLPFVRRVPADGRTPPLPGK